MGYRYELQGRVKSGLLQTNWHGRGQTVLMKKALQHPCEPMWYCLSGLDEDKIEIVHVFGEASFVVVLPPTLDLLICNSR